MKTTQIPRSEWPAFLDRFNRQHEGWLVKLEIFDPEIGAQVEETGLPLSGLTHMLPDPVVNEQLYSRIVRYFKTHVAEASESLRSASAQGPRNAP